MPSTQYISGLFNKIAGKYDMLNNLLSLGTHWLWKRKMVRMIAKESPENVLDAATGTGDIAELIFNQGISVTGVDLSKKMIEVAKKRNSHIPFYVKDLNELDFKNEEFEISCISFGIRNTESVTQALRSLARVTEKKIYILEFGSPENPIFRKVYFFIMNKFIPFIGKLFSFKKDYKYLIESSVLFPSDRKFIEIADETKLFKSCRYKPVFLGICYIYILEKS